MRNTGLRSHRARLMGLLLVGASAGFGQMRGGMMGGSGEFSGYGMAGALGGMMGGSLSGMMGGSGLTIGPDGTLYLTRSTPASGQGQSAQTASTQVAAIDSEGKAKWSVPINSPSASQPAIGKDGTLFVTTSDWFTWMYDWMYNRSVPQSGATASLVVIKPGTTSASILATVRLTGQIASAPQIATDAIGNYVVYVVSVDGFTASGFNTGDASASYLYAFSSSGALKYKLQLSQGGSGMMGF